MICGKRPYVSIKHARDAHRRASFRVRPYWCDEHRAWHVTNDEKRSRGDRAWR